MDGSGPAWLGIGAQRCGTTWFTRLLVQHPDVCLSSDGRKELHALYQPNGNLAKYRRLFDGLAGEFTPYYLRSPLSPRVAAAVVRPDAPIIVLLRDPVERYASAMRLYAGQAAESVAVLDPDSRARLVGSDAAWGGMYATQLAAWKPFFGDRLLVMQYEAVKQKPRAYVERVWEALGVSPVPLRNVEKPTAATSAAEWEWPQGLRESLVRVYRPEVERLRKQWGVDPALWPNFS